MGPADYGVAVAGGRDGGGCEEKKNSYNLTNSTGISKDRPFLADYRPGY